MGQDQATGGNRPETGPRPELRWIDKRLLTIEPYYQRQVSSKRGQNLIAKLAANWIWAHASVLVVAPKGDKWAIIDGQHRHQASLRRSDINDLPCLIVGANSIKAQAAAFIAHNRDRVSLGPLAIFFANQAAGDPVCCAVISACAKAGVVIKRAGGTVALLKPDESLATGSMSDVVRIYGEAHLADTLALLRKSFPTMRGQLRGNLIKGCAAALKLGVAPATLIAALKTTTGQLIDDAARLLRHEGLSIWQAYIKFLTLKCGLEISAEALARETRPPKATPVKKEKPAGVPKPRPAHQSESHKKPQPEPKPAPKLTAPPMRKPPAERFVLRRTTPREEPRKIEKLVEHRGNIPVRRFEGGTVEMIIDAVLAGEGLVAVRSKDRGKDIWKIGHRKFSRDQLIRFVDEIRAKKNLPPIMAA